MLFNSFSFVFLFLPLTLAGYLLVGRLRSRTWSLSFIVLASIVFYGAWNPINLLIIAPSIAINYALGIGLQRWRESNTSRADLTLVLGVVFNLCFLGYFKYKNFFLDTSNLWFGTQFAMAELVLPLGISFITFQKIAFLVDIRSGAIERFDIYDFLTFVFFFPQLIAGPIVHYREMMPQFERLDFRLRAEDFAVGIGLFSMGLFKKVMLADNIAVYASPVFRMAEQGQAIDLATAWIGALAYAFQIYFDFSGYSDMAIGLARMFGIRLPVNFNSPFKASSIIEFWSRWHMTLTRFLTAYVYTPVLMSLTRSRMRRGKPVLTRKAPAVSTFAVLVAFPTIATMLLSGLWHGAGFTFIAWGLFHGVLLAVNHAWRQWKPSWNKQQYERVMRPLGWLLTFLCVIVGLVLFRANTLAGAGQMLLGMSGWHGIALPAALLGRLGSAGDWLTAHGVVASLSSGTQFVTALLWILALLLLSTRAPNSLDLMRRFEPALLFTPRRDTHLEMQWNRRWAWALSVLFVVAAMGLGRVSEFLYWQF